MEKRARILIPIMIFFLIILVPLISLKFTGFLVKEPQKQIQFHFYDETNNCPLDGYIFIGEKPIGKSENGYFDLTYNNYIMNIENSNQEVSIFGKLGNCFTNPDLFFDKYWTIPKIEEYHFLGESVFNFKTKINSNNPTKRELQGFIQPEKVSSELDNLNLKDKTTSQALSEINNYLNNQITYTIDWDFNKETNYWQVPSETINLKTGDCEDYSTTLLSLFTAYNNQLNCYNIVFTSHVTTFCYIEDYYAYYDQEKTQLIKKILNNQKTKQQLEDLNNDYFKYYGINKTKSQPHYAFNDKEFIEFNGNSLVDWQFQIKNTKQQSDLFLNIENKIIQNIENLSDINLETGELKTATISLPNSKSFPTMIVLALAVLLVFLVIIIIKIRKNSKGF